MLGTATGRASLDRRLAPGSGLYHLHLGNDGDAQGRPDPARQSGQRALITGEAFGLTPEDRVSLVATPGFDASLWELGMALLHGMAIVPVSRALRDDPWALKQWYKKHGVTVAFHAPSYLRVSKEIPFDGLRVLITGGEAPNHDDARRHADCLALWNAYGPTETCIFMCAERLSAARP